MKLTKIIAVLLCLAMAVCGLASCAKPDTKTTVKLQIKVGEYILFNEDVVVKTPHDSETGPSVLDVLKTVMDNNDKITIELENDVSLKSFAGYYNCKKDNVTYMWEYLINGDAPDAGKADTNYVKEGDTILYHFIAGVTEGETTTWSEYNNESGAFD